MKYPHVKFTRNCVETGLCVWPIKGIMFAVYVGGRNYITRRDTRHMRSLALGRVLLLVADVRQNSVF